MERERKGRKGEEKGESEEEEKDKVLDMGGPLERTVRTCRS